MRIGIDATFIRPGAVGGAEHALRNLIDGLALLDDETELFIATRTAPWEVAGEQVAWWTTSSDANRFVAGWHVLRRHGGTCDALLCPNYFTPPLLGRSHPPILTVIHDLQYRHYPQTFTPMKRLWLRSSHEWTMRSADTVAVPSSFVRSDLLECYGERWAPKVRVLPNAVSWARFGEASDDDANPEWQALRGRLGLPQRRYFLSVCAQYGHKNLATLIRAFGLFQRRTGDRETSLVLAGQPPSGLVGIARTTPATATVVEEKLEDDVLVLGYASDRLTGALYRHALAFAFPSLFEGFGLPPVEALGFGLPVIASRSTSIPEVTLGLCRYVEDPIDVEELAAALEKVAGAASIHAPGPDDIARIRARYDPKVVARAYHEALTDRTRSHPPHHAEAS